MTTATFRFVPIPPNVVIEPPVKLDEIRFDRPLDGGSVSAVLKVTWTAMTPICIGDPDPERGTGRSRESPILPIKIGNRHCLTGTTLRGMARAVLEAATFSHLGRINEWRHHGFRDFAGLGPDHSIAPIPHPNHAGHPNSLRAGWLRYEQIEANKYGWVIYKARNLHSLFILVPISSILGSIPNNAPTSDEWRERTVSEKYNLLPPDLKMRPIPHAYQPAQQNDHGLPKAMLQRVGQAPRFTSQIYPTGPFVIVCGGKFVPEPGRGGNIRQNECLFPLPSNEKIIIPDSWMQVFHRMHSDPGRDGGDPRGTWREWLRAFGWHQGAGLNGFEDPAGSVPDPDVSHMRNDSLGIPVFWKGESEVLDENVDPGNQSFWFSLSRVMRVPFRYSVGQMAQALYMTDRAVIGDQRRPYSVPRMRRPSGGEPERNGWDFTRAIFGEIDGANVGTGDRANERQPEQALRGRVAFEFAFAKPETEREPDAPVSGVFSQPRESFWPFYLRARSNRGRTRSYNSDQAIPAGRKRTVVRRGTIGLPQGNENERTMSHVRFLPAGVVFEGRIRVHNLHPVEFGALLWALTFGDVAGNHWHQAGRAKGYGYGALKPKVEFARGPTVIGPVVQGDPNQLQTWFDEFTGYMNDALEKADQLNFDEHPSITALTDMANPATSQVLANSLNVWPLEGGYAGYTPRAGVREGDNDTEYLLPEPPRWR